ncbi:tRNA (adenosine(37)-N6)-threonylcarbamoyltransferase complex ATPase subunit type 1 TsaE [Spiroplasma chrysopicola]|uniref:tRNA threonylcarbamoyladenosine biosynthesis protein TsaE n=1 Tax=Spiroplasma chrysopicola DF-1 TaxID=1276227 RepID=R4UIY9_9MOLU|nr:tRNA (adenosine(37)-N6)-threonylcarbamoyltransferase complex ATPase subunit type 1 TsaE [Spiroplasma chrysopicola]AGM25276.1 hypothetical protein SCHRY_v1c07000 [Spiroplasma chrysopicola DF-1]
MQIKINSLKDSENLAQILAQFAGPNQAILFNGPLAAGKTTITKLLLTALGYKGLVTSPTFVIMNQYQCPNELIVNHFDFYRLLDKISPEEAEMYLDAANDCYNIIEWPAPIKQYLPLTWVITELTIEVLSTGRLINISTTNPELLAKLEEEFYHE